MTILYPILSVFDLQYFLLAERLKGSWKDIILDIVFLKNDFIVYIFCGNRNNAIDLFKSLLENKIQFLNEDNDFSCILKLTDREEYINVIWNEIDKNDYDDSNPFIFRPIMRDIALLNNPWLDDLHVNSNLFKPVTNKLFEIDPKEDDPQITAFFSFKGGVGRTVHIAALAKYLSVKLSTNIEAPKVLLIDADLEAPGLTWWIEDFNFPHINYSFVDLLGDMITLNDNKFDWIISTIKSSLFYFNNNCSCYFIPSFRKPHQTILRPPLNPCNLVPEVDVWEIPNFLLDLGKKLGVDYILVDLRAGLSDLSSPLFYDPRVQRILVSSTSFQSIAGTNLSLTNLVNFSNIFPSHLRNLYANKTKIIISFIQDIELTNVEDKITEEFDKNIDKLCSFTNNIENEILYTKDYFIYSNFDQNLLGLGAGKKAFKAINSSLTISETCSKIIPLVPTKNLTYSNDNKLKEDICKLKKYSKTLLYSESYVGDKDFLVIQPYRSFAQSYQLKIPNTVIIGAKGSGKTFLFNNLVNFQTWTKFSSKCGFNNSIESYLIPLIWSKNITTDLNITYIENSLFLLNDIGFDIKEQNIKNSIINISNRFLTPNFDHDSSYWNDLWFEIFCTFLNIIPEFNETYESAFFKKINQLSTPLVFLLDGLEDLFSSWLSINSGNIIFPLHILLYNVINKIDLYSNNKFGIIVFIREDIVRKAILQNSSQFISKYEAYQLYWNKDEALRLIGWILGKCGLFKYLSIDNNELNIANFKTMSEALKPFWGLKLGKDNSNEAYTSNWILGAISDFKGNFQARDIVRILFYSATYNFSNFDNLSKSYDRLLTPSAIKNSLSGAGKEKIKEIKEEILSIANYLDIISNNCDNINNPVAYDVLKSYVDNTDLLEEFGIIFRDHKESNYYFPEIYRCGLNLKVQSGKRPRVISLMRQAWRNNPRAN
ncbi:MAG: hypothetical protein LBR11_03705 [Deltaproteobacteria bacterium]|jgi:cellulose biosynthesis protein BcsQ|nr:hypothetical protein [Deltaproteobacteria bacterium]